MAAASVDEMHGVNPHPPTAAPRRLKQANLTGGLIESADSSTTKWNGTDAREINFTSATQNAAAAAAAVLKGQSKGPSSNRLHPLDLLLIRFR